MAAPSAARSGDPGFGVYVHIPFCRSRCDYCAFATWDDRPRLIEPYVRACLGELRQAVAAGSESQQGIVEATTVFFGGGTPSLLATELLVAILDEVPRREGAEVTVECNPEDASPGRFEAYRQAGVTRLSFGVQSMAAHVLGGLGRAHDPAAVVRAVQLAAEAGIPSYSVDLIFGGSGESDEDWRSSLEAVVGLDPPPPHVSAYALTVEPGTPLAADRRRHPDEDAQARRYEMADSVLSGAGLSWYELSNWARPGHECRHNQLYWAEGDYRGFGCSAHSHRSGHRWWNIRTPLRYIEAVKAGRSPVAGEEMVEGQSRHMEEAVLALRTRAGVAEDLLVPDPALDGLVERRGGRAVLTLRGRLLANEVAARL